MKSEVFFSVAGGEKIHVQVQLEVEVNAESSWKLCLLRLGPPLVYCGRCGYSVGHASYSLLAVGLVDQSVRRAHLAFLFVGAGIVVGVPHAEGVPPWALLFFQDGRVQLVVQPRLAHNQGGQWICPAVSRSFLCFLSSRVFFRLLCTHRTVRDRNDALLGTDRDLL